MTAAAMRIVRPRQPARLTCGGPPVTGSETTVENPLQHLVQTRLAELGTGGKAMSGREAARRSKGMVSYETVRAIAGGKHSGRVEPQTAEGLAVALEVPVARIYEAAGIPKPQGRWVLPDRFDRMPLEQRRAFEDMMAMVLNAYEDGYQQGRRATE